MKAKAHKLFGGKKGDQVQNEDTSGVLQNANHQDEEVDAEHGIEKQNGVGPPVVFFRDGVGTQQTANGDYQEDSEVGDDENEEVRELYFAFLFCGCFSGETAE